MIDYTDRYGTTCEFFYNCEAEGFACMVGVRDLNKAYSGKCSNT